LTTLYLIRHAQSLPSPQQPEPDWPLSPIGSEQARQLAPILERLGIRTLYSSPYRRCRATLAPFAQAAGIELRLDEGLRERRIAPVWQNDFRDLWRRSWEDFSYALEGGESSWACRSRIAAAVEAIAARHDGETVGLGSHGNAIALFMHYVDGSVGIREASDLRTPEIVKVTFGRRAYAWDRRFSPGAEFERLATDFRLTPGVVA